MMHVTMNELSGRTFMHFDKKIFLKILETFAFQVPVKLIEARLGKKKSLKNCFETRVRIFCKY